MIDSILTTEIERLTSKAAIYGDGVIWQQNEFCEILPNPTPLSLSLLRELASAPGATGMVCRELGIDYSTTVPMEDYLETIFGRTFVNRAAERELTGGGNTKSGLRGLISSVKIQAGIKTFYREFRTVVNELDTSYQTHKTATMELCSDEALREQICTLVLLLNKNYRHVVKSGLFAKFCLDEMEASVGAENLPELLQADSHEILRNDKVGLDILAYRESELVSLAGFGAEVEYELSCPRYRETMSDYSFLTPPSVKHLQPTGLSSRIKSSLAYFKSYESLKVIYKTLLFRELSLLRTALLAYDRNCDLDGGVFYLQLNEIFSGRRTEYRKVIQERQQAERAFSSIEVPSTVTKTDLPLLITGVNPRNDGNLKGLSVNGLPFSGHAVLYKNKKDFDKVVPGQIVVTRHASSELVTLFGKAGGIVTETGGLLSHLAIVAREHGFPVLLQARDATMVVQEGAFLNVDSDGTVSIT